jgi:hypothetical protein
MSQTRTSLILLGALIALGGCSKEPKSASSPAAPNSAVATPAATQATRPPQEIAFIRECLAVGLRPSILMELESKAIVASGSRSKLTNDSGRLSDFRASFSSSSARLKRLSALAPTTHLKAFAQILGDARAKQAADCSRLTDALMHEEGVGLMMIEFAKISFRSSNYQEADRKAGEHLKQNWQNLTNLPYQQKAALKDIIETEQQLQQVVAELNNDAALQSVQKAAIADVVRELEDRAQKAADTLTPVRFYETLIGHQFLPTGGRLEAGEMVKLLIKEQKIVGHCIVSVIQLDLRSLRGAQTASLNLSVVHKTYADGRPVRLLVTLQ